jgi:hypothetical protein
MTALGKLFRTTAFKLTLVYLLTFVLFAAIVLVYFAWNTRRLINEQITQTVDSETVTLQDEYDIGGIRRLIFTLDARARRPDSYLYLLTTAAGEGLAGNVGSLTAGVLERSGWTETAIASSRIWNRPSTTRWRRLFSCRVAFACWSDAISRSATACMTS